MNIVAPVEIESTTTEIIQSSPVVKREIFNQPHEAYVCLTPEQGTPVTIHLREPLSDPKDPFSKEPRPFKPGYEVLLENLDKAIKAITDLAGIGTA